MAKAKSPAKSKSAAKSATKSTTKSNVASKPKAVAKKAAPEKSGKLAKAAANVVKALTPKKPVPAPTKAAPSPPAKPAPVPSQPAAKPAAQPAPGQPLSWSESLRKAMQEKNAQKHWPDQKQNWKDHQKTGLSISHRDKFG